MTSASWMLEAGHSKLLLWDNPEGRGGEGGERWGSGWGDYGLLWLTLVVVWQNPLQYCKEVSVQLKEINFKKKIWSFKTRKIQKFRLTG